MLDPLTAISLASSIVSFVDFGSKLLIDAYGAYQSHDGAKEENLRIETIYDDLKKLSAHLVQAPGSSSPRLSDDELALQDLARQCVSVSEKLLGILDKLKVKGTGPCRFWYAIRQEVRRAGKF